MNFEPIDLNHKETYEKYTNKSYRNSEASFTNMYLWRKITNACVAIIADMLVLRVHFGGKYRFLMPFGKTENINNCIYELLDYCDHNGYKLEIIGANSEFVEELSKTSLKFSFCQDRNAQDYVYLSQNLAELSGKKLHSKRNHINKFKSSYNYVFTKLKKEHFETCIQRTKLWMDKKYDGNHQKYQTELDTVKCLFENYDKFDLIGGAIFVEEELVAYTVGEGLSNDTALVHIEKADVDYHGAFTVINNEFAKLVRDKYFYINREEDMGIEGLRKAKQSYKPEFLTDKYKCIFE